MLKIRAGASLTLSNELTVMYMQSSDGHPCLRSPIALASVPVAQSQVSVVQEVHMPSLLWRVSFVLIGIAWTLSAQTEDTGFPEWLGGKPDVEMKTDRCGE